MNGTYTGPGSIGGDGKLQGAAVAVTLYPSTPLAVEMLEHWAAKLYMRNLPGDTELAQRVQAAAEDFRGWQKANP